MSWGSSQRISARFTSSVFGDNFQSDLIGRTGVCKHSILGFFHHLLALAIYSMYEKLMTMSQTHHFILKHTKIPAFRASPSRSSFLPPSSFRRRNHPIRDLRLHIRNHPQQILYHFVSRLASRLLNLSHLPVSVFTCIFFRLFVAACMLDPGQPSVFHKYNHNPFMSLARNPFPPKKGQRAGRPRLPLSRTSGIPPPSASGSLQSPFVLRCERP